MYKKLDKLNFAKIIFVSFLLSIVFLSYSYARIGPTKSIDPSLKPKIVEFLKQRGYANITPKEGNVTEIDNGYFLKLEGIDKTANKNFAIEIVCSSDYKTLYTVLVKEQTVDKIVTNK